MLDSDFVGDAGLSCIKCGTTVQPALNPPVLNVEQLIRVIRGGKQQLPSCLVAVVTPEPLDAIEEESHVSCGGTFGQRVEETARIIVPLQDRDESIHFLLLVRRQKLRDPQRRIGDSRVILIKQPVNTSMVVL